MNVIDDLATVEAEKKSDRDEFWIMEVVDVGAFCGGSPKDLKRRDKHSSSARLWFGDGLDPNSTVEPILAIWCHEDYVVASVC